MPDRRVPLWVHAVGLGAALLVLTAWVRTDVSYSVDEPAAIIQAQLLAAGDGWLLPNPLPSIDPAGDQPYLVLSDRGDEGTAPYAKHPAYPALLALADRIGGQTAMVLLSVAGALAAAVLTARIARRIDPALEVWTLWAAGLASPLFFDSQLVIAHTLGTAAAAVGVLAALRLRRRWSWAAAVGGGAALVAATVVRTEAVLFAVVLAAALAAGGVRGRDGRRVATGVTWVGAAGLAVLADRWLLARITGAPVSGLSTAAGRDALEFLATRVSSTATMLLAPGEAWATEAQLALFLVLVSAIALGVVLRRPTASPVAVGLAGGGLVAAALAPFLLSNPAATPGILIVFPALTVGLLTVNREVWEHVVTGWLLRVGGAYALLVALTQYAQAGGVEWGARYLAVALPVLVPAAVASVSAALRRTALPTRRVALGCLVAGSLATTGLAAWSLRYTHDATRRFAGRITEAAAQAPGPDLGDGDRRPIVLATWFAVGRLTSVPGPDVRGLTVTDPRQVPELGRRLREAGVERFVLVSEEPGDLDALAPWYHRATTTGDGRIVVMEAGPGAGA
jgi:hypothetical protein